MLEAPQPSQGATDVNVVPMWRSLDPRSERNSLLQKIIIIVIVDAFTLRVVLVKVSFGERGGTYRVFQKKLRENA